MTEGSLPGLLAPPGSPRFLLSAQPRARPTPVNGTVDREGTPPGSGAGMFQQDISLQKSRNFTAGSLLYLLLFPVLIFPRFQK